MGVKEALRLGGTGRTVSGPPVTLPHQVTFISCNLQGQATVPQLTCGENETQGEVKSCLKSHSWDVSKLEFLTQDVHDSANSYYKVYFP